MSRYFKHIIEKSKTGKNVYEAKPISRFEDSDNDIVIITTAEDRLDLLAKRFYDDETLWYIIAYNNNLTEIDLKLKEGTQLKIPSNPFTIKDLL
jgi:hypothetical protein